MAWDLRQNSYQVSDWSTKHAHNCIHEQRGRGSNSTTAVLFSSWLEKRRKRVMLIDADAQVSSSRWLDNRKSNIEYVTQSDPNWILDGFN